MESSKQGILQFPWTENRELETVHDVATQFTSQELAARYKLLKDELDKEYRCLRMKCFFNEFRYDWNRSGLFETGEVIKTVYEPINTIKSMRVVPFKIFLCKPIKRELFFPPTRRYDILREKEEAEDLLLGGGACEQPRPALPKTRRRRVPPPRVSRRSSEISQPIYQRHRFLPQSRKQSSSRRQR